MIVVATLTKVLSNFTAGHLYVCNVYISWRALVHPLQSHSSVNDCILALPFSLTCVSNEPFSLNCYLFRYASVGWLRVSHRHVKLELSEPELQISYPSSIFWERHHHHREMWSKSETWNSPLQPWHVPYPHISSIFLSRFEGHEPMHTSMSAPWRPSISISCPDHHEVPPYLYSDGFMIYLFPTHHLEYFKN